MKISIVIPVYNTSQFLCKCLDSIINQTYKNIEIICVNDGSTDNSAQILESYQQKDSRIKIITQTNQGLCAARNAGIKAATGDYIGLIDSDDWIDLDFYEKLYSAIIETNSDIAAASIVRVKKTYSKPRITYQKNDTYDTFEQKIKACNIPKCCYVWNKLYKKSLVENLPFKNGVFYEDILWTPVIIKNSNKLTCVAGTNYYYRANSNSIVKKRQSIKKQQDFYNNKKFLINFLLENGIPINEKQKYITKSIKYLFNFEILKTKEYKNSEIYYFLGIPFYKKNITAPIIKDNTFIVWEPCSTSHSEVVPGYCKYLLDLGYHVSVLVNPKRYKEGLFSRFENKNLSLNYLTSKQTRNYFKNTNPDVKGILVTTVGKICDCVNYNQCYSAFHPDIDKNKLFFVEHESSFAVDKNTWNEKLITLRELNYKNAKSIVINPHYFGNVNITPKNDITTFITIGSIKPNKKNSSMIIESFEKLYEQGYKNFKLTVVGNGNLSHISNGLKQYIEILGRLPFDKMYNEIEKADFLLTCYNEYNPEHIRYNTSGTSGNFQLMYGFLKPAIITRGFAPINGLNDSNAILYSDDNYVQALKKAIDLSKNDYQTMQDNLKKYTNSLYQSSLNNFKELIGE